MEDGRARIAIAPRPVGRLHLGFDGVGHRVGGVLGDMSGVFTNSVIVSIIAPRYFCSTVMLCAIERTSVPASIEALQVLLRLSCWQGLKPLRQIDVQARRDRALGLVEDRLEVRRQDQVGEQLLAVDVVRVLLLEEHHRVRVQDEARLAPIGRRLAADDSRCLP